MNKNKKIKSDGFIKAIVFCFVALFCWLFPSITSAAGWQLEVGLPNLGGGGVSLSQYMRAIYVFAGSAVGIVGVLMFMVGGFQYMIAAGNKAMSSEAKKTMLNAIIGIALVLASYVILKTINVDLVNPKNLDFN